MASPYQGGTGNGILLYGVIIHDKIKTANLETLRAYKAVGEDLLKEGHGHDEHLKSAMTDLDSAIKAKSK